MGRALRAIATVNIWGGHKRWDAVSLGESDALAALEAMHFLKFDLLRQPMLK
jgi:hypothetical protein